MIESSLSVILTKPSKPKHGRICDPAQQLWSSATKARLKTTGFWVIKFSKIIFIIILMFPSIAWATNPFELFPNLIDTLLAGDQAAASVITDDIIERNSGYPVVHYVKAVIIYQRMIDEEDTTGQAEFFQVTDSCVSHCDLLLENQPDVDMGLWYLKGSALSAAGVTLLRNGETIRGARKLLAAKSCFDDVISADPAFYDAYLGRGTYRCAVAQKASGLGFLPFIPDFHDGLNDLKLAADSSRWSRWTALNAIAWFAIDDDNFFLADSVCRIGLARFPNSRAFLWPTLALSVRRNQWLAAEQTALRLLDLSLTQPGNGYELTTLYWRLMVCADRLGRMDDAVTYAQKGIAVTRTPETERRRREKIDAMQVRLNAGVSGSPAKAHDQ